MDWLGLLQDYGTFLLETITIVAAIVFTIGAIITAAARERHRPKEHLTVTKLNERFEDLATVLKDATLSKAELKDAEKKEKKADKAKAKEEKKKVKAGEPIGKSKTFVLDFDGDIRAHEVHSLREEITAILQLASTDDEVCVRLESPGGMVHGYGLASSQLARIKQANIPLTVCVDKVAASGGYMMACVANKILAAPFSIIGSIGVLAEIPNFNRLLKAHNIDYELHTAGEYKRTLTMFGENTDEGREKFQEELQETHELFKQHIESHRPQVDLAKVATGEHWFGSKAFELKLVDDITTSDDYLLQSSKERDLYLVKYEVKPTLSERLSHSVSAITSAFINTLSRNNRPLS